MAESLLTHRLLGLLLNYPFSTEQQSQSAPQSTPSQRICTSCSGLGTIRLDATAQNTRNINNSIRRTQRNFQQNSWGYRDMFVAPRILMSEDVTCSTCNGTGRIFHNSSSNTTTPRNDGLVWNEDLGVYAPPGWGEVRPAPPLILPASSVD